MNAFDRAEEKRRLLNRTITDTWVEFSAALESLIGSYNRGEGRKYPATIKRQDGHVIISNRRGFAPDQYRILTIRIHVAVNQGQYVIRGVRERYQDLPTTEEVTMFSPISTRQYAYTLDGNPETGEIWLISTGLEHKSAFECAEEMLVDALSDRE